MCVSDPQWRVRANALAMRLSRPNNAVLVTNSYSPGGTELLNASEFAFKYEAGWEIALDHRLNEQWDIDGRLFRIDGFIASRGAVLSATGAVMQYATPLGNTVSPATIAGSYASQLTNVELNARRRVNDIWSIVAGFRYLSLNESGLAILDDLGPGLNLATNRISATNDLYGFQVGADANMWTRNKLSIEGMLRAGVYSDQASNDVQITEVGPVFASHGDANHTAFAGEVGIAATYRFNQHVSLRGGYQLLWLEGVAQASDQVAASNPATGLANVSFKSSPLYDGVFVGFEFAR